MIPIYRCQAGNKYILTWKPGLLRTIADSPDVKEVKEAMSRIRLFKDPHTLERFHTYRPSIAYLKHIEKVKKHLPRYFHATTEIHGILWGKQF